jgi:hypothetical protein
MMTVFAPHLAAIERCQQLRRHDVKGAGFGFDDDRPADREDLCVGIRIGAPGKGTVAEPDKLRSFLRGQGLTAASSSS